MKNEKSFQIIAELLFSQSISVDDAMVLFRELSGGHTVSLKDLPNYSSTDPNLILS